MSFQSLAFLAFLAAAVLLSRGLGRMRLSAGKTALLLCCLYFCAQSGWRGFAVLALGTAVSYLAAPRLVPGAKGGRRLFPAAMGYHILVLLAFKYLGFLTGGAVAVPFVPLGLSFFTFQQLWYLKECHRGETAPAASLPDFLLYSFFFPTLSSGPILKPEAFLPQLTGERFLRPDGRDCAAGLYALGCGLCKKMLLADPLGVVVGNGWDHLTELSAVSAWFVILGYTLQLYFDFSGYCDMAAGCARLLGLRLPVNFDSPYLSLSVTEFWKRWHMTLTSFLRECVYFPLGGSRKGPGRTYLNILLVFLLSGLWHGAGWTFLLWGALHGAAQVIERLWGKGRDRLPAILRWALTFAFVNLAWVFFRAPDIPSALTLLRQALTGGLLKPEDWLVDNLFRREGAAVSILLPALEPWLNRLKLGLLFLAGSAAALLPGNTIRRMDTFRPTLWRALALSLGSAWAILSFTGVGNFLYSNF